MNPESALRNENLWIGLEEVEPPYRRLVVRQIAGLFARRIVCNLRPGEILERGQKFGMIKLGSRTELILPAEPGLELCVAVGRQGARRFDASSHASAGPRPPTRVNGKPMMRRIRTVAVFPTMFTLGNLVCGFFSIVVAARVDAPTAASIAKQQVSRDVPFKHPTGC